jgi:6-phospho-beta-glucosidase
MFGNGAQLKPKISKFTVLGSGSTYTPELLNGFLERRDDLEVDHISLFDIHAERLEITGDMARRMFARAGLPVRLELTDDLERAVEGADFVVSQIRVGGMAARIRDERIPLSHNVLGQETVGAGGVFKAFRTIPVILQFAKVIERLAPNAWFLNFTNPAGIITEALIKHSALERVVGLCNVPINSNSAIAEILNVNPGQVWLDWIGLNHLGWIRRIQVNGLDRLGEVLGCLSQNPPESAFSRFPFEERLLSTLQLLPSYYLRYYYETPQIVAEIQKIGKTRAEIVAEIESSLLELYKDTGLDVRPDELHQRGGALYSEAAFRLIYSLLTDRRDTQILIVKNNGAINGLPDDVAVEVPVVVGAHGVSPLACGRAPLQVHPLIESVKTSDILTVQAAVSGSRQKAVHALSCNPLVPSHSMAEKLFSELVFAHKDYLPQFF